MFISRLTVLFMCIYTFVASICYVNGESMWPTLYNGDIVLVNRLDRNYEHGDIVVTDATNSFREHLVKRVVAIGGDEVDISDNGELLINGEVSQYNFENGVFGDIEYPFTVPEGSLFLMGDNRNHSTDSRFKSLGAIRKENIVGTVIWHTKHNEKQ